MVDGRELECAAVVHDLKNPLAAIALETELLEHELADSPPAVLAALARIRDSVIAMDRRVCELLDRAAAAGSDYSGSSAERSLSVAVRSHTR